MDMVTVVMVTIPMEVKDDYDSIIWVMFFFLISVPISNQFFFLNKKIAHICKIIVRSRFADFISTDISLWE